MHRVVLFAEDLGHERFLTSLCHLVAAAVDIQVEVIAYNATGGHGKVLRELDRFVRDLRKSGSGMPDTLLVVIDANCSSYAEVKRSIEGVCGSFSELLVCGVPDPHVERWMLVDSQAFKRVFGRGCDAPDQKCDKDRYKEFLINAIANAGTIAPLGGMEFAPDVVQHLRLDKVGQLDASLGQCISDLRARFRMWARS